MITRAPFAGQRKLQRLIYFFLFLFLPLFSLKAQEAGSRIQLIKSKERSTVYFLDPEGMRHAFPSPKVYESWYGNNFSRVIQVSDEYLASLPLGKNVMLKHGNLLKVPSSGVVYAVEPGGTLRQIQDESVAQKVFGNRWFDRIREIPEFTFQNYALSNPVREGSDVPDGFLIAEPEENAFRSNHKKYYLKWKGTLRLFQDENAMSENVYRPQGALTTEYTFSKRLTPILGREARLAEPSFTSNLSTATCDFARLRLGVVVVTDRELTKSELGILADAVLRFPAFYDTATEHLGSVQIDPEVIIIPLTHFPKDINRMTFLEEAARYFFDFRADTIDFLAVFNTRFPLNAPETAVYVPVSNPIKGVGKFIQDRAREFGSLGRLKGVLDMQRIEQYTGDYGEGESLLFPTLAHEIMHSLSGGMEFTDAQGMISDKLFAPDRVHWSQFLMEPSLLGSYHWKEHPPGIFTRVPSIEPSLKRAFSNLDLYAFGFIPARSVPVIEYIDVDPTDRATTAPIVSGVRKTVTIDQISDVLGKRECVLQKDQVLK